MSSSEAPRFLFQTEDGSEIPVSSVESLSRRVSRGEVEADTPLFDASTGAWSPAGETAVFRFIVEELEAEGWAPEPPSSDGLDFELTLAPVQPHPDRPEPPSPASEEDPGEDLEFVLGDWVVSSEDEAREPEREAAAAPETGPSPREATPEPSLESEFELSSSWAREGGQAPQEQPRDDEPAAWKPRDRTPREGDDPSPSRDRESPPTREPDPKDPAGIDPDAWDLAEVPTVTPRSSLRSKSAGTTAGTRILRKDTRPNARAFRLLWLLGASVAMAAWFFMGEGWDSVSGFMASEAAPFQIGTSVVASELDDVAAIPQLPVGLEGEAERMLQAIATRFGQVVDSLRADLGLANTPPGIWLSGQYLGNASDFPEVPAFWRGYGELVEQMRANDRPIYAATVRARAGELEEADSRAAIEGYFTERYAALLPARRERFYYLELAAANALALHAFLVENQERILYTPASGSVALDPVLEAGSLDPAVQSELEQRLDQVLAALDRSRQGGAPSVDGLRFDLFLRFREG